MLGSESVSPIPADVMSVCDTLQACALRDLRYPPSLSLSYYRNPSNHTYRNVSNIHLFIVQCFVAFCQSPLCWVEPTSLRGIIWYTTHTHTLSAINFHLQHYYHQTLESPNSQMAAVNTNNCHHHVVFGEEMVFLSFTICMCRTKQVKTMPYVWLWVHVYVYILYNRLLLI